MVERLAMSHKIILIARKFHCDLSCTLKYCAGQELFNSTNQSFKAATLCKGETFPFTLLSFSKIRKSDSYHKQQKKAKSVAQQT